jgi:hypothetical protein
MKKLSSFFKLAFSAIVITLSFSSTTMAQRSIIVCTENGEITDFDCGSRGGACMDDVVIYPKED